MDSKTQEHIKFDKNWLDDILKGVKTQDDLWGENGVITQLSKALIERMLNAEMDYHLNDVRSGTAVTVTAKKPLKVIQELSKFQLLETVRVRSNLKSSRNGLHVLKISTTQFFLFMLRE